jgi:hypothetical protein
LSKLGLNFFSSKYSPVLAWRDATQPEQIEAWREEVETLADSDEKRFLHAFPEKKEKWRTEHVVTWLAGCAPGLKSQQLLDLNKQEIAIESLLEGFNQPAASRQAQTFPYNLTAGSYERIHIALVRHRLIPPGNLLSISLSLFCGLH